MVQVAAHSRVWLDTVAQVMDGVKEGRDREIGDGVDFLNKRQTW